MPQQTLTHASFATVALRAALRAQPTFRLPPLVRFNKPDVSQNVLSAMQMCAWSGLCVFWSSYDRDAVLTAIRHAKAVALRWHLGSRPEFFAAVATEMYLLQSPEPVSSLDGLFSATRGLDPADFVAPAVQQIQADIDILAEVPDHQAFARRPLWLEEPPMWRHLVAEYASHLGEYGFGEIAQEYPDFIEHVTRGELDLETPRVFFRQWLEEPHTQDPETGDQTPPSASAPDSSRTRLDLTAYSFSQGALQILANAVERLHDSGKRSLATSGLVLEMVEQGHPTVDPQWIGDFVRQAVSAFPKPYAAALESAGFRKNRRRVSADDPDVRERMKSVPAMPGLAWSLERARTLARDTTTRDTIAGRHLFASLILDPPPPFELGSMRVLSSIGLSLPLLRQRLFDWVRGYSDNDAAWRRTLIGGVAIPRRRAGFDADSTTGQDFLDIEQDVLALATLIAARESSPPLSIGLFGDWGSGKTFFMKRLRGAVADLSAEARAANVMQRDHWFYKRIVQIEFNAWHYVEGNLWASLVEHILSNLRFSEEPEETVTEQLQKSLLDRLGFTKLAAAESEKKQQDAATKVTAAEGAVRDAKDEHDTKKQELQTLSSESVTRDFDIGGVTDAIAEALKPLGIVPAGKAVADMEASLRLARSVIERGQTGLASLVRADDRKDRWRSLLIILIGAPVATGVLTWLVSLMTQAQIARISMLVTGAAGLLAGMARWIRLQAEWLAAQQDKVEEAQRQYDAALSAKLAEQAAKVANKEQELALARQDYLVAQQRAEQARREQEAAGAELTAATTPRLLGRFIQDRAASNDYRKHLGVLAVVRQDFQQISELIEEDNWRLAPDNPADEKRYGGRLKKVASLSEEEGDKENATRINRIVLYIDDLDRCPPAKVVEVLQAVHLLLAFPLFVVVVGVDARWISRSLESRYRELLRVGDKDVAGDIAEMFGVARSEDYLEKIFQIPLWLRRMDANAARRMVQGMLRPAGPPSKTYRQTDPSVPNPETMPTPMPDPGKQDVPVQSSASPPELSPAQGPNSRSSHTGVAGHAAAHEEPTHTAVNPETFTVRNFEIDAIDALSPLLGRSPRALKRFVNVYRLIKAGLTPAEHDVFIGQSKDRLDDFAAVLFLLAVDTGLPRASTAVFDVLLTLNGNATDIDVKEFVERLDAHPAAADAEFATLRTWIEKYRESRWFQHDAVGRLAVWTPPVMRYSFQAARIVGEPSRRRSDPSPTKPARSSGGRGTAPAPAKRAQSRVGDKASPRTK